MKSKCPLCQSPTELTLIPSKKVTECTVPSMIRIAGPGGRDQYRTYDTDRTITWQCTNKKCSQSKKIG